MKNAQNLLRTATKTDTASFDGMQHIETTALLVYALRAISHNGVAWNSTICKSSSDRRIQTGLLISNCLKSFTILEAKLSLFESPWSLLKMIDKKFLHKNKYVLRLVVHIEIQLWIHAAPVHGDGDAKEKDYR